MLKIEPLPCDTRKIQQIEADLAIAMSDPTSHNRLVIELLNAQLIVERSKCCLPQLNANDLSLLESYISHLKKGLTDCQTRQVQLDLEVRNKCGRVKPGAGATPSVVTLAQQLLCKQAQQAAATNSNQCQALQAQIAYVVFLLKVKSPKDKGCFTQIGLICWLWEEDYYYNRAIPGTEAVSAGYKAMMESIDFDYCASLAPGYRYRGQNGRFRLDQW